MSVYVYNTSFRVLHMADLGLAGAAEFSIKNSDIDMI